MSNTPGRYATLSEIAGRKVHLLAWVTLPLYVAGAVIAEGPGRWVSIGIGLVLGLSSFAPRRVLGNRDAPITLGAAATIMVLFGWLTADFPLLAAAVLAAQTVYNSLMLPRRWAGIGLVLLPAIYAALPVLLGLGSTTVTQAAAVATMNAAVAALLLHIRITTEQRVAEHTSALAAVNGRLEVLNGKDPLTALANRRTLDETLTREWNNGQLTGRPVGFIMIDIDHFKRYNDHYGHPAGDACLRLIAATLADSVRDTDLVARYGGEEFSIILPGASLVTTYQLAERVQLAVEALHQEHAASPDGYVSVSVGAASAVPDQDSPEELIRAADRALYEAKNHGRNRVYV